MLVALAICNSYAIEPSKDMGNKDINSITQQMNNTTLDNVQSNINNINNPQTSVAHSPLFDIKKLITTKHFIKMNEDEKDWARLDAYDRLSKASQEFWQTVITEKKITDTTKAKLYCSQSLRLCVLMGVDPLNVIFDELKFNINPSCLVNSDLYLSSEQLSELKEQVIQCVNVTRRHVLGIRAIQEHLNMNNSNLAERVYWKLYHKKNVNLDAVLKNLQKKNP